MTSRPVDAPLQPRVVTFPEPDEPLIAGDVRIGTATGPGPISNGDYCCAKCATWMGLRRVQTPSGKIRWACSRCLPPAETDAA